MSRGEPARLEPLAPWCLALVGIVVLLLAASSYLWWDAVGELARRAAEALNLT